MKELQASHGITPNASQEVLIERVITLRKSTFDALKSFMRDHELVTRKRLTNAAAIDMILRSHLRQFFRSATAIQATPQARLLRAASGESNRQTSINQRGLRTPTGGHARALPTRKEAA